MEYSAYDFVTGEYDWCIDEATVLSWGTEADEAVRSGKSAFVVGSKVVWCISEDVLWETNRDIDIPMADDAYLRSNNFVTQDMIMRKHGGSMVAGLKAFEEQYPKSVSLVGGKKVYDREAINYFCRYHEPIIVGYVKNAPVPTAVVFHRRVGGRDLKMMPYNANGVDLHIYANGVVCESGVFVAEQRLVDTIPAYMSSPDGKLISVDDRRYLVVAGNKGDGFYLHNSTLRVTKNVVDLYIPIETQMSMMSDAQVKLWVQEIKNCCRRTGRFALTDDLLYYGL